MSLYKEDNDVTEQYSHLLSRQLKKKNSLVQWLDGRG
jgi:hypothetical protein